MINRGISMGIFDTPCGDCTYEYPLETPCGSRTNCVMFRGIKEPSWVRIVLQYILWDSGKIFVARKAKTGMVHSVSEDCR